jgi:hypothetical protein
MTEIPPPPVEKVIELPRLFRATAICGKNVSVTGAVLEDGNYVWSGSGTEGKCKLDKVECFLTDVKFEA